MVSKGSIWLCKDSGEPVKVLFVSGFRLTYQQEGSLKVASVTEFLDNFKADGSSCLVA